MSLGHMSARIAAEAVEAVESDEEDVSEGELFTMITREALRTLVDQVAAIHQGWNAMMLRFSVMEKRLEAAETALETWREERAMVRKAAAGAASTANATSAATPMTLDPALRVERLHHELAAAEMEWEDSPSSMHRIYYVPKQSVLTEEDVEKQIVQNEKKTALRRDADRWRTITRFLVKNINRGLSHLFLLLLVGAVSYILYLLGWLGPPSSTHLPPH